VADIFYTVGPQSEFRTEELIEAGATGARLTFSYSTQETQLNRARNLKKLARDIRRNFFVIADLEGGKSRLGEFGSSSGTQSIEVRAGEEITIVNTDRVSNQASKKSLPLPDRGLFNSLSAGNTIIIGDSAAVIDIKGGDENGKLGVASFDAVIEGRRGIFIQNADFNPICLTDKDIADLKHISQHDEYDSVAVSFVSSAADLENARNIMRQGGKVRPIIAKIETAQGAQNVGQICKAADYVMIGRGDLALSTSWVRMASLVESIVKECVAQNVPWIMATQVAEGLRYQSLLTRAEMCDLWHWVKLGCFGVLLSHETAWGPRPVDAVQHTRKLMDFAGNH
jgi:pyruvate kinase